MRPIICHNKQNKHIEGVDYMATTVPNSWAHTMQCHLSMYRTFLEQTQCSHLWVASEWCLPLIEFEAIEAKLEDGVSYFVGQAGPDMRLKDRQRAQKVKDRDYRINLLQVEQWHIISRPHAELLLSVADRLTRAYNGVVADNEHFHATGILTHEGKHNIKHAPIVYCNWDKRGPHPHKYTNAGDLPQVAFSYWSARKVQNPATQLLHMKYDKAWQPKHKVAVVCANYGSFDGVNGFVPQSVGCDYHYFTDQYIANNRGWTMHVETPPVPKPHPRMQAKYYKLQAHKHPILSKYEHILWIDGRIDLKHPDTVKHWLECAGDWMAFCQHPDRNCAYEEAEISTGMYPKKYSRESIDQIIDLCKSAGLPVNAGLWAGTYFARANNEAVNDFFDRWWEYMNTSIQDQVSLSLVAWLMERKPHTLPFNLWRNQYITLKKHLNEDV